MKGWEVISTPVRTTVQRIHLLDFVSCHSPHIQRNVQVFEIFSGKGQLSASFRQRGHRATTYDLEDDPDLDFGSTKLGWQNEMLSTLQGKDRVICVGLLCS